MKIAIEDLIKQNLSVGLNDDTHVCLVDVRFYDHKNQVIRPPISKEIQDGEK